MIHLIYISSATRDLSEMDLLDLLHQSRDRNKRQNVTGMLLFKDGAFLQVLEGEADDVDEIYASITLDDRNAGNYMVEREEIVERNFTQWSMGFKDLTRSRPGELDGYTDLLLSGEIPDDAVKCRDMAVELLLHF